MSQPIFDAVHAHNAAHRTRDEAAERLKRYEKIAPDAMGNIFLGGEAGARVESKLEEAKASLSQAEELVRTTNDALPNRLQSGMH